LTSALLFVVYHLLLNFGYDLKLAQTFTFASFGTYTLFMALSIRNLNKSLFTYSLFTNYYMLFGVILGLILMAFSIYSPVLQKLFGTVPLSPVWVLGVFLVGAVNILFVEGAKNYFKNRQNSNAQL
jgi:Ca2+-transporting ATPase